jgi:hypothetical protein
VFPGGMVKGADRVHSSADEHHDVHAFLLGCRGGRGNWKVIPQGHRGCEMARCVTQPLPLIVHGMGGIMEASLTPLTSLDGW